MPASIGSATQFTSTAKCVLSPPLDARTRELERDTSSTRPSVEAEGKTGRDATSSTSASTVKCSAMGAFNTCHSIFAPPVVMLIHAITPCLWEGVKSITFRIMNQ
eukprot:m.134125 g.134125  ORF g.134125 m.134125 type:complete len:105 (+) comp9514_c0_seq1:507-821(+)